MNRLRELLLNKLVPVIPVIRRDKGYVALLIVLIVLFTITMLAQNQQPDTDADAEPSAVSEKISEDAFNAKLQRGEAVSSLKMMMLFLMTGTVWGIGILSMSAYRLLRRKIGKLSLEDYLRQDEHRERVKAVFSPWSLWDVVKILIVFFTAYLSFILIQELLIAYAGVPKERVPLHFLMIIDMLCAEVVAIFFLFRLIRYDYDVSPRFFGLSLARLPHHIGTGIKGYFMFLPVYLLIVLLVSNISRAMGIELKAQEIISILADKDNFTSFQFNVMVLFVGVFGPVCEEIFFRGFLYRTLKKSIGRAGGLIISSVLFALIHNNFMAFFPIFGLGIMLGLLLDRTSSLIPSIVMHVMVNSVSMFMVFSLVRA